MQSETRGEHCSTALQGASPLHDAGYFLEILFFTCLICIILFLTILTFTTIFFVLFPEVVIIQQDRSS